LKTTGLDNFLYFFSQVWWCCLPRYITKIIYNFSFFRPSMWQTVRWIVNNTWSKDNDVLIS
jgi:hypothetical protein